MPYRAARRPKPIDPVQRTALHRARTRREQEVVLIAVDCRICGQELASVLPGADCWCRPCQVWTPSLPCPKRGVVRDG